MPNLDPKFSGPANVDRKIESTTDLQLSPRPLFLNHLICDRLHKMNAVAAQTAIPSVTAYASNPDRLLNLHTRDISLPLPATNMNLQPLDDRMYTTAQHHQSPMKRKRVNGDLDAVERESASKRPATDHGQQGRHLPSYMETEGQPASRLASPGASSCADDIVIDRQALEEIRTGNVETPHCLL